MNRHIHSSSLAHLHLLPRLPMFSCFSASAELQSLAWLEALLLASWNFIAFFSTSASEILVFSQLFWVFTLNCPQIQVICHITMTALSNPSNTAPYITPYYLQTVPVSLTGLVNQTFIESAKSKGLVGKKRKKKRKERGRKREGQREWGREQTQREVRIVELISQYHLLSICLNTAVSFPMVSTFSI